MKRKMILLFCILYLNTFSSIKEYIIKNIDSKISFFVKDNDFKNSEIKYNLYDYTFKSKYNNLLLNGKFIEEDFDKKIEGSYIDNLRQGDYKIWYEDFIEKGKYKDSVIDGEYFIYDKSGKFIKKSYYNKGIDVEKQKENLQIEKANIDIEKIKIVRTDNTFKRYYDDNLVDEYDGITHKVYYVEEFEILNNIEPFLLENGYREYFSDTDYFSKVEIKNYKEVKYFNYDGSINYYDEDGNFIKSEIGSWECSKNNICKIFYENEEDIEEILTDAIFSPLMIDFGVYEVYLKNRLIERGTIIDGFTVGYYEKYDENNNIILQDFKSSKIEY